MQGKSILININWKSQDESTPISDNQKEIRKKRLNKYQT